MAVAVALSLVHLIWDNSCSSYSPVQYGSCESAEGESLGQISDSLNPPVKKGSGGLAQQSPGGREGEASPSWVEITL